MLSIYHSFEIYCVEAYTHRVHICIFFVMEIRSRDRIYELHNEQEVLSVLSRIHENEYLHTTRKAFDRFRIYLRQKTFISEGYIRNRSNTLPALGRHSFSFTPFYILSMY